MSKAQWDSAMNELMKDQEKLKEGIARMATLYHQRIHDTDGGSPAACADDFCELARELLRGDLRYFRRAPP